MKKALLFTAALYITISCTQALALTDPNAYHWAGQEIYFEGWYFKVSDPATGQSFLFIYAVYNPDSAAPGSTAFIMAGRNSPGSGDLIYQEFDTDLFSSSYEQFDTAIGDNNIIYGDLDSLHAEGAVSDAGNSCEWNFDLTVTASWPFTMGWMAAIPGLQTYWHVGAMKAAATGWISWNGERFEFEEIIGYQEKNWGDEFPETWFWIQANDFDDPDACCLSIGGASMPIGPVTFNATGIGFRHAGRLYTFSFPQQPARIIPDIQPGTWRILAAKGRHKIEIDASCDTDHMLNLMNPTISGIVPWTWESIAGSVSVRLYERRGLQWSILTDTSSGLAGTEFGGKEWLGWDEQGAVRLRQQTQSGR